MPDPWSPPVVFDRSLARANGYTDSGITRRLANGSWTSLRRGQLSSSRFDDDRIRWRARVLAAARSQRRDVYLSHQHGAYARGLPMPLGGLGPVTFIATSGSSRFRDGVIIRRAPLSCDEVEVIGAVLLTSVERMVVDCCRTLHPRDALAITDAAVRRRLVTAQGLTTALERAKGWPGAARARVVIGLADGRRETPLESWSAWAFAENGVPSPIWQADVLDERGNFVGRPDALWDRAVAGEADGRLKYRLQALERGGVGSETLLGVLDDERRREGSLRRLGLVVVRWGPGDVLQPSRAAALAVHLTAEIGQADPSRFRGAVVLG